MASLTFTRKSLIFFLFSGVCIIAALIVGMWQLDAQQERANIRATGQRIDAVAVSRKEVEFFSTKGTIRTKPIVAPMQGTLKKNTSIFVIYDRDDPTRAILEQDDTAFNITIWVVVTKLSIAGLILLYFGDRARRSAE